jgi:hypothetical protein
VWHDRRRGGVRIAGHEERLDRAHVTRVTRTVLGQHDGRHAARAEAGAIPAEGGPPVERREVGELRQREARGRPLPVPLGGRRPVAHQPGDELALPPWAPAHRVDGAPVLADASWRNHSSQWPPMPWIGPRRSAPTR